eukprot:Nk52_evm5s1810 gene=Nk52_evmTU5s1810
MLDADAAPKDDLVFKPLVEFVAFCGVDERSLDVDDTGNEELIGREKHDAHPLQTAYIPYVLESYPDIENTGNDVISGDQIASFCFADGFYFRTSEVCVGSEMHSFVLTKGDGEFLYGMCLVNFTKNHTVKLLEALAVLINIYNLNHPETFIGLEKLEDLHVPNAITLLSSYPCFDALEKCIAQLYELWCEDKEEKLSKCIVNMILCVPAPTGGYSVDFSVKSPIVINSPGEGDIPFYESCVSCVFDFIKADTLLVVMSCLLSERSVLVVSKDLSKLCPFLHSCIQLLFPFSWKHIFVPVLPHKMAHILEAPLPYFIGYSTPPDFFENAIVDLDQGKIANLKELSPLNFDISGYLKDGIVKCETMHTENREKSGIELRKIFLDFFAECFHNYGRFVSMADPDLEITSNRREYDSVFERNLFIEAKPISLKQFTEVFTDSQLFRNFINAKACGDESENVKVRYFDRYLQLLETGTQPQITLCTERGREFHISVPRPGREEKYLETQKR